MEIGLRVAGFAHASLYVVPVHPALAEAWRVTEGLLIALRDEVRAVTAHVPSQ